MVDEVLQNYHNSVEGGHHRIVRTYHRVKSDYYWIGLYADVAQHVQSCEDCCTSKSKPHLKGYSPGNIVSDRPFHIVSMDFVIPLPRTRRGNTALLLFQDHFTGFVIAKAVTERGALEVAKVFEENVFRRFGAPSSVRHDRDPRFMSEVFQKLLEMTQSRSRTTLSYRPQANGQQERSVKTMIQTSAEAPAESMGTPAESTKSLFKEGDQVWLFMERVKQGLTKRLAHRWHGPFGVKSKVEEFAYELELPDRSRYSFYPVTHVSQLKKVVDTEKRPTIRVIAELEEDQRFVFDEELLPEDSWESNEGASQYEVEAILDDELPLSIKQKGTSEGSM
ncbi:reverse transcriptase [Phytophthora palmivora]|uniref:Reverse transcriptase n=1 Tax=Phytophthora palmivora TaxID=4796 RepID=A0A2P4X2L5_9STRA|nr:reverse transcriptase [Phytophthora palmivora]